MWKVYIVQCSDKSQSLYTGITNNLEKRIATHNKGKGAKYLRGNRLPVKLLVAIDVGGKSSALQLEYKIKQLSRAEKLRLVNAASIPTRDHSAELLPTV